MIGLFANKIFIKALDTVTNWGGILRLINLYWMNLPSLMGGPGLMGCCALCKRRLTEWRCKILGRKIRPIKNSLGAVRWPIPEVFVPTRFIVFYSGEFFFFYFTSWMSVSFRVLLIYWYSDKKPSLDIRTSWSFFWAVE